MRRQVDYDSIEDLLSAFGFLLIGALIIVSWTAKLPEVVLWLGYGSMAFVVVFLVRWFLRMVK